jgi:hypothetical protein
MGRDGSNRRRDLGANFSDFPGFVEECDPAFISRIGGEWNGKLDAFND